MDTEFVTKLSIVFLFITSAAARPSKVALDIEGKEVQDGYKYEILPLMRPGAPVTFEHSKENIRCPNGVIRPLLGFSGTPVTLRPVKFNDGPIYTDVDLYVEFHGATESTCTDSYLWTVSSLDKAANLRMVTIGGSEALPPILDSAAFRIIEVSDPHGNEYYRFEYCVVMGSTSTSSHVQVCRNVGVDGEQLVVGDVPPFEFTLRRNSDLKLM